MIQLIHGATGLLDYMADANGNVYNFQYDSNGRLTQDSDPAGGVISLARTDNSPNYNVAKVTALGTTTGYAQSFTSTAGTSSTQTTMTALPDGTLAKSSQVATRAIRSS